MRQLVRFIKQHFGPREWIALATSLVFIFFVAWMLARIGNLEKLGYVGGFIAMLISSATVVLPAPGLAVVAALGVTVPSPLLLGIAAGAGATLGEITGYLTGYSGHKVIEEQKHYERVKRLIEKYGFWAIAFLAFIPNPLFDIAGIIAGATRYPVGLFLSATLIGKTAKCIAVAYASITTFSWLFG